MFSILLPLGLRGDPSVLPPPSSGGGGSLDSPTSKFGGGSLGSSTSKFGGGSLDSSDSKFRTHIPGSFIAKVRKVAKVGVDVPNPFASGVSKTSKDILDSSVAGVCETSRVLLDASRVPGVSLVRTATGARGSAKISSPRDDRVKKKLPTNKGEGERVTLAF
jgi:hypothetical protein